jgi:tRNA A-37 threonylcarbamoyl transferase component Bud32
MRIKPRIKSRPVDIRLNTAQQQLALRIALLFSPTIMLFPYLLWLVFKIFAPAALALDCGLMLLALLFPWVAIKLSNNKLRFTEKSLKFPATGLGFLSESVPYEAISEVHERGRNLIFTVTNRGQRLINVDLAGISKEDAVSLWTQLSTKVRQAKIDPEVRKRLKAWANENQIMQSSIEEKLADNLDLRLLINLKQRARISSAANDTEFKFWIAWFGSAVALGALLTIFLITELTGRWGMDLENLIFGSTAYNMLSSAFVFIQALFGNPLGAALFIGMLLSLSYKVIRDWTEADSIFIDSLGLTSQVRTPAGTMPQEHLSWSSIKSIELIERSAKKNQLDHHDAVLLVTPAAERPPIVIPVKCFSSQKIKSNFLEALDSWGRRIAVDPKIVEVLTPQADSGGTFTEMWLSSLDSAPKLDELTPLAGATSTLSAQGLSIDRILGSGGQGMTYLASNKDLKIVLKEIILPVYMEAARKNEAAQFEREAAILKELDHPGIVKLHDYFVVGNRAYLALEYLDGITLKEKIEIHGPMPAHEVLPLAKQMSEILAYLHERTPPVVHRDFTPDNLILDNDGRVKLIDFGVALKSEEGHTAMARAVGKQNYVPPEQFRGKPCQQSDLYSLGATLFFLLTGTLPEPLSTSTVPAAMSLSPIIEKATELSLADRYFSARAMLEELSAIADGPTLQESSPNKIRLIVVPESEDQSPDDGHSKTEKCIEEEL